MGIPPPPLLYIVIGNYTCFEKNSSSHDLGILKKYQYDSVPFLKSPPSSIFIQFFFSTIFALNLSLSCHELNGNRNKIDGRKHISRISIEFQEASNRILVSNKFISYILNDMKMIGFANFELKNGSATNHYLRSCMVTKPKMQNMFRTVSYLHLKVL